MAKETIKCDGSKLNEYISFIEKLFTGPGIRVEHINENFIELHIKRYYPRRLLNEKIQRLETKLKEDGRI